MADETESDDMARYTCVKGEEDDIIIIWLSMATLNLPALMERY